MSRAKRPVLPPRSPTAYLTRLVELVAATAWVIDIVANPRDKRPKPVSFILISEPGKGKTELLEQFRGNTSFHFSSDATYRGFLDVLEQVNPRQLDETPTHIIFTEFQKVFQRRSDVWAQMMSLLSQAIEEGVFAVDVFEHIDLGGKRIGLIGAMTSHSLNKHITYFREMGFLSRTLVMTWTPDKAYFTQARARMRKGRKTTKSVKLHPPKQPVRIRISESLGKCIGKFVHDELEAPGQDFRPEIHIRAMVCAAAYLRGARAATRQDLEYVRGYKEDLVTSMDTMTRKKHREGKA